MSIKKKPPRWELDVYAVNSAARCVVTIANLERLCEKYVPGRYRIRVVDLGKSPDRARLDQIVAVPTVARRLPLPERRVVGTLSDARHAAAALEMGAGPRPWGGQSCPQPASAGRAA